MFESCRDRQSNKFDVGILGEFSLAPGLGDSVGNKQIDQRWVTANTRPRTRGYRTSRAGSLPRAVSSPYAASKASIIFGHVLIEAKGATGRQGQHLRYAIDGGSSEPHGHPRTE